MYEIVSIFYVMCYVKFISTVCDESDVIYHDQNISCFPNNFTDVDNSVDVHFIVFYVFEIFTFLIFYTQRCRLILKDVFVFKFVTYVPCAKSECFLCSSKFVLKKDTLKYFDSE